MATYNDLHKYFVLVPAGTTDFDGAIESTKDNQKIFFDETTKTIWAKGTQYGASPETLERIANVEKQIDSLEKINISNADDVADYLVLDVKDVLDADGNVIGKTPEFSVNVVSMNEASKGSEDELYTAEEAEALNAEHADDPDWVTVKEGDVKTPGEAGKTGLVDAADVKSYIDSKTAAGTTVVTANEAGDGVKVSSSIDEVDGHTEYQVALDIDFVYVAGEDGNGSHLDIIDKSDLTVLGSVDVDDIIGNGLLSDTSYDNATGVLTLTFKQADGSTKDVEVDFREMLDINDVSISEDSLDYLKVTLQGDTEDDTQAVFGVKIVTMEDATASDGDAPAITGLADALDVKTYVDDFKTEVHEWNLWETWKSASEKAIDEKSEAAESDDDPLTISTASLSPESDNADDIAKAVIESLPEEHKSSVVVDEETGVTSFGTATSPLTDLVVE